VAVKNYVIAVLEIGSNDFRALLKPNSTTVTLSGLKKKGQYSTLKVARGIKVCVKTVI
jgi:hypothetical protein